MARPVDLRQLNRREEIRPGLLVCLAILESEVSGHTDGDRSEEDGEHDHELQQALSTLCFEKPQDPHWGTFLRRGARYHTSNRPRWA